jgi:Spy/CpxP family protein refolding chaperone
MRRVGTMILTLGLMVALAAPALAQQRQRGQRGQFGGRGQGGVAMLIDNESVQKELNLDKDQVDKAKEAVQKVRDNHKDEFAKLQDLGQDERRQKGQELSRTVSEESLKALADVLKPEQLKRLKQIELQQAGDRAFTRPDVQKALSLTDDQKEQIKTITDDAAKQRREIFQAGNAPGSRDQLTSLRKETSDKIQAVLTDDQKKTWKDLTGEPFQLTRGQRRRPGTAQ